MADTAEAVEPALDGPRAVTDVAAARVDGDALPRRGDGVVRAEDALDEAMGLEPGCRARASSRATVAPSGVSLAMPRTRSAGRRREWAGSGALPVRGATRMTPKQVS